MSVDSIQIQLTEHERRLGGLHKKLGGVQVEGADHTRKIAVLETEMEDVSGDISEIKAALEKDRDERRKEGADTRRALYTVAAFMATFSASIVGLIIALLGHA